MNKETEFEKLGRRLASQLLEQGFVHQSVSRGEKWSEMTFEEKAAGLNSMLDRVASWKAKPVEERLYIRANELYKIAKKVSGKHRQMKSYEWLKASKGEAEARQAWGELELPLMLLRQELEAVQSYFGYDKEDYIK